MVVTVVVVFVVDWLSPVPVELGPHDATTNEVANDKRKQEKVLICSFD